MGKFKTVEGYLAAQPDEARVVLARVRGVIRKALPKADEAISYDIPAYKIDGRTIVYFAGWKAHYSLYPVTKEVVAELKDELSGYAMSKGTVRFPFEGGVPAGLIGRIAKIRARQEKAAAKAKVWRVSPRRRNGDSARPEALSPSGRAQGLRSEGPKSLGEGLR